MLVGGSWMSDAAVPVIEGVGNVQRVCHTFCTADVGGPVVKDGAFISIFFGEL